MIRRALLLSVALVGALGCTNAWAGQTKVAVRGEVSAVAFAGDATIVARQRSGRNFRVERLVAGAPAQTLLRLPRSSDEYAVELAASTQSLAVSVADEDGEGPTHVYVGSPSGPLREVAACQAGLLLATVSVSGPRIAWTSGGCGRPVKDPVAAEPAAIVIGAADPAVPLRLIPLDPEELPTRILLEGQGGLVGLIRPSFFSFLKSEVRRLGASSLGEVVTREDGGIVMPVGSVPGGTTIFTLNTEGSDEDGGSDEPCERTLFALAPSATQRRDLRLGGCLTESDLPLPDGGARVAGDRVYAIVDEESPRIRQENSDTEIIRTPPRSLKSLRADGSAPRLIARGGYRRPLGFTTDAAGRVAWWQNGCLGNSEIVLDDGVAPGSSPVIPACKLRVLTRTARVRRGQITVRLRCPSGCLGDVSLKSRYLRAFRFGPGTHRLRVRLSPRQRRIKPLRLRFSVEAGPARTQTIRLR